MFMRIFAGLVWLTSLLAQSADLNQLQLVGQPGKLESEIVAVKDVNNRFCAAVKIISDMDGFSYQSYNGVVRVEDEPGQDLVFLSPDERVLEIYHGGYEPLKVILSEIGVQLRPRQVWQIKISGEKQLQNIPIAVITDPPGANVILDGKPQGQVEQLTVSKGSHQVRLQMQGYEPVIQTIIVDEKSTLFKYTLQEIHDVPVELITNPSGAVVYLDDLKFGNTPLSEFYPSGRYPIRIEKQGYVTYEDVLEISPPRTTTLITLQRNFGTMRVQSEPETGLEIYLNGQPQGVTTPHTFQQLRPGQYIVTGRSQFIDTPPDTVTVERGSSDEITLKTRPAHATLTIRTLDGAYVFLNDERITNLENIRLEPMIVRLRAEMTNAVPVEKKITLKRGENKTIEIYPEIETGTIQVAVVPFEAKIRLIGDAGQTYEGQRSRSFSDIPVGTYRVRVSCAGYRTTERTVVLEADEKEKLTVQLGPLTAAEPKTEEPAVKKKSKWLYYAVPAAVLVGAGVLLGSKSKGSRNNTSIVVDMPVDY